MTVVPLAFQLCGWIPAWWRGSAGGDDILELVGAATMAELLGLRAATTAMTAFSPELGVGVLPGPKPTTEAAVAAGQAVILHSWPGQPATVLVPMDGRWHRLSADPARPIDLDLRQATSEFTQAVVSAEHELRNTGTTFDAEVGPMSVRPLPPGADGHRQSTLVRAARVWTAVAALPREQRTPALEHVLHAAARATLAAYTEPVVPTATRTRRFA